MARVKSNEMIVVFIILLAIPAIGYYIWKNFIYFPYETVTPHRGTAVDSFTANGEVEAEKWIAVVSNVSGEVLSLPVEIGKIVKKGDLIAQISDSGEKQAILDLQETIDGLTEDRDRMKLIIKENPTARGKYDRILSDLERAEAEKNAELSNLDKYKIVATADGTLLKQSVAVGQLVSPGKTCFWIGEAKPIVISALLDNKRATTKLIGHKVVVKDATDPAFKLESQVKDITPVLGTGQSRAIVAIDDKTDMPFGKAFSVEFVVEEKLNALLVPIKAVKDGNVYVVSRNKADPVPVEIGVQTPDSIEIKSGLSGEENIVPDANVYLGLPPEEQQQTPPPAQ